MQMSQGEGVFIKKVIFEMIKNIYKQTDCLHVQSNFLKCDH